MLKKIFIILLLFNLTAMAAPKEFRAVKLTNVDSRVLFSDEAIAEAMDYLASIGINVILPVVWNGSQADGVYTLYPSQIMENLFGQAMHPAFPSARDPLERVIIEAHRNGMEVMPWFEMGFSPSYSQNGGHILARFPNWALENRQGQMVVKNGFDWMSAINPAVQDFIISLVTEVADKYDIDGIEFSDRIPALPVEGGYDAATIAIYQAEHNNALPPPDYRDSAWMRWRADKLTAFNQRVRDSLRVRSPHLIFSSSPSVYPWSYDEYLQDSYTWVLEDVVDNVIPQLYRYNFSDYLFELNKSLSYTPTDKRSIFFSGMLVYLKGEDYLIPPEFLADAIQSNREKGVNGEAFFFYEGLRVQENLIGNTLKTIYNGLAPVPHRENIWRPEGLIVNEDDPGAIVEGNWTVSDIAGFQPKILINKEPGYGAVTYFFEVPYAGWFDVFLYNVTGPLATDRARCTLFSESDSSLSWLNQQDLYRKGWQKLASVYLQPGQQRVVRLDNSGIGSGEYVVADAAMLLLNRKLSPDVQVTTVPPKTASAPGPATFKLAQNYPNPFNAQTTIQFELRTSNFIQLKIINVLGQEIETLVAQPLSAGTYAVPFSAEHLTSGIYFYQLQVGQQMQQRKFLLLR